MGRGKIADTRVTGQQTTPKFAVIHAAKAADDRNVLFILYVNLFICMKKLLLLLTAVITLALSGYAQNRSVHGTVVDSETDEPLIGATVMPLGGGTGTATDVDGNFTLSLPAHVKELQISYVGYGTQKGKAENGVVVKMVNNNALKEVVVTGYGSGKKLGSIVGSVSVVGEDALENIPTATFIDALQGQVAGLSIFSDSATLKRQQLDSSARCKLAEYLEHSAVHPRRRSRCRFGVHDPEPLRHRVYHRS